MSNTISSWPVSQSFAAPVRSTSQGVSAQEEDSSASASLSSSVEAEFLKFAQMTPEERVQKAILDKLGMTEEEFNKLDAKGKADVMAKVRDEILRQMEAKGESRVGALADISV